jgi:hypothetical protein
VTGRPESPIVSFPLGWITDPAGMACMISLFQERTAWGNKSCKILSLLFPLINDPGRLKLHQLVRHPLQNSNNTLCLSSLAEWELGFLGNVSRCSEARSFEEGTNKTALNFSRTDICWYSCGPLLEGLLVKWSGLVL